MGFTGAILAVTAASAVSSVARGYAEKSEANYNAQLYENQATVIDAQKEIEYAQYEREKGKYLSKSIVSTAGAGIGLSGSALSVMLETQKQIGIDQAIGQFDLETQKQYKVNQAGAERRTGRTAVYSGYADAFSTLLKGGVEAGIRSGYLKPRINTEQGAEKAGRT